ncbi:MAG: hypothetical protein H7328_05870 [Bdellovibrio sp.]|nr:hypothetical protein [Bdellovibrio sp.]
MNMKKIFVAATALFMMGCEEMDGQLTVSKNLNVKSSKNQNVVLNAGTYNTTLDFKKDKVEATVKANNNSKLKIVFDVPNNAQIPANGNFELKSAQTGQPVDVIGNAKTVQTQSAAQTGWEQCQVSDYQTICNPQGCTAVPVNRWGQQYTEYYLRNTDKNINFTMTEVGSVSKKLAQFQGASRTSQKVIIRQDRCF